MSESPSSLSGWTPEQIAQAKRWVETWKQAGPELERIRREELRRRDPYRAIEALCYDTDRDASPVEPPPTSGLIEQQRWFKKAAGRE